MATNSDTTDEEPTLEDARTRLTEAYHGYHDEDVGDLAQFHDAATAFLAILDSHALDALPDDLDATTKRRFNTAKTQLPKAISGIEQTALARLKEADNESPDEGGA
mgnify:CR=1 FL=1